MSLIIGILVNAIAVFLSAYIIPGVTVDSFFTAALVGIVLGVINAIIRPILVVLTLPINVLTLGLFTFVINGLLVMLVARIVPGFHVQSFWTAILFSIVLAVVGFFLGVLKK